MLHAISLSTITKLIDHVAVGFYLTEDVLLMLVIPLTVSIVVTEVIVRILSLLFFSFLHTEQENACTFSQTMYPNVHHACENMCVCYRCLCFSYVYKYLSGFFIHKLTAYGLMEENVKRINFLYIILDCINLSRVTFNISFSFVLGT